MLPMLTGLLRNGVAGLTCHLSRANRRNITFSMSRNELAGHAIHRNNAFKRKGNNLLPTLTALILIIMICDTSVNLVTRMLGIFSFDKLITASPA